jgi:flagellar biosynthetic protein FlhB
MAADQTGDKTEDPTARKLEKALEEGQIAFSSELLGGLMLLAGMFFFLIMGRWFFEALRGLIRERITLVEPMIANPDTLLLAIRRDVTQAGLICASMILPITVVILFASFLQTRFNLTTKPLALNWGRLQPASGIKRMFSSRSVNRGGVAIAKASAIVIAVYFVTLSKFGDIASAGQSTLNHALSVGGSLILAIGFLSAGLMVIVGIVDYAYQWWKQREDLRMTLQEVRDEHKESEGDPQLKARVRRLAGEMSKKRMMSDVPNSSVVITNPTHFAVALRYDPGEAAAPVVLAKGADFLAKQIIKVAKEHGVPVVERKPVARFLFAKAEIGEEIPYEIFQAVAEILNFIKRLERDAA